ncbi:MAG: hypothetical protein KOO62_09660 [candidate division Zixibacteria bacterium]|nr:hypothetical protein [candidate division Zixibacteria bacterium]
MKLVIAVLSLTLCVTVASDDHEMLVDYDRLTYTIDGKEHPFIIDYPECLNEQSKIEFREEIKRSMTRDDRSWVDTIFNRFDLHIDDSFSPSAITNITNFFSDTFHSKFEQLEAVTGWSSEQFNGGTKLEIYIIKSSEVFCWAGFTFPSVSYIYLDEPFFNESCKKPHYVEGVEIYWEDDRDYWFYTSGAIHETLHSINPPSVLDRSWITEGFSQYYQYNLLVDEELNQETADIKIYSGNNFFNWDDYVANDYHDNCTHIPYCVDHLGQPLEAEIQHSRGYSITTWMFSMLRDTFALDWSVFYGIMATNHETLTKSATLGPYYTDTHIIDLFGRALGISFDSVQAIFRYDGPSGPGWA